MRAGKEFRSFFELHLFDARSGMHMGAVRQLVFGTSAHSISMMGD
jgi:hypothetical protein